MIKLNRLSWFYQFVSRLFHATKAFVVEAPFYAAKDLLISATGEYLAADDLEKWAPGV